MTSANGYLSRVPAFSHHVSGATTTLDSTVGTTDPGAAAPTGRTKVDPRERRAIKRLARKDPRGLEEVYELTSRACFSVVLGIVRDRGHAEDVQQTVYAEVWRRAGQFDPARGSLLTWVLTIGRSRALDHLRRRSEQPMESDALAALGGGLEERAYEDVLERALVGEALARLPEQERDLLRMRFWDGLSQTEIADLTGQPLGTIKSRMTSGLRSLRDHLSDLGASS